MAQQDAKAERPKCRDWITDADLDLISEAWENYEGALHVFESAIGAYFLGRFGGYDALRVIHNSRTLRRYEAILGKPFKVALGPDCARTADSDRVNAIRMAKKAKQFWKALAGGLASKPGAKNVVKA